MIRFSSPGGDVFNYSHRMKVGIQSTNLESRDMVRVCLATKTFWGFFFNVKVNIPLVL